MPRKFEDLFNFTKEEESTPKSSSNLNHEKSEPMGEPTPFDILNQLLGSGATVMGGSVPKGAIEKIMEKALEDAMGGMSEDGDGIVDVLKRSARFGQLALDAVTKDISARGKTGNKTDAALVAVGISHAVKDFLLATSSLRDNPFSMMEATADIAKYGTLIEKTLPDADSSYDLLMQVLALLSLATLTMTQLVAPEGYNGE